MENLKNSLSVEQLEDRFEMADAACRCFNDNDVQLSAV